MPTVDKTYFDQNTHYDGPIPSGRNETRVSNLSSAANGKRFPNAAWAAKNTSTHCVRWLVQSMGHCKIAICHARGFLRCACLRGFLLSRPGLEDVACSV